VTGSGVARASAARPAARADYRGDVVIAFVKVLKDDASCERSEVSAVCHVLVALSASRF